jgi:hypothetical protein
MNSDVQNETDEINRILTIFKKKVERGEIEIPSRGMVESISKIKQFSDGTIDLSTVDGRVMAMVKAMAAAEELDTVQNISLLDVQKEYYLLLENFFGKYLTLMLNEDLTPQKMAISISRNKSFQEYFRENYELFKEGIRSFWIEYGSVVKLQLMELDCCKAIYGGDIFPVYGDNLFSPVGLYMDTIVLPDPLLKTLSTAQFMPVENALYYFSKHALAALAIKDLVLAEVSPPIVVIAPEYIFIDENHLETVIDHANQDFLVHAEEVFGIGFESKAFLDEYLDGISDFDDLVKKIKSKDRLLFDAEMKDLSFREQWENVTADESIMAREFNVDTKSVGEVIKKNTLGRMMSNNSLMLRSIQLGGVPLIDAPTSWQYYLWKCQYDKKRLHNPSVSLKESLIVNSLQGKEIAWLGNVPSDALIKLRKEGALCKLREIISRGISEIEISDVEIREQVYEKVTKNIDQALKEHQKELDDLNRKSKKFYGYDVSKWIVIGGLTLAAPITGIYELAAISAGASYLSPPKSTKELRATAKEIKAQKKQLKTTPLGILFKAKENK